MAGAAGAAGASSAERRRTRAARFAATVLAILAATGCAQAPEAPVRSASAEPSPDAPSPSGSASVGCDAARPDPEPTGIADLIIGPLSYGAAAEGIRTADGRPAAPGPDGIAFYKIGTRLALGASATVAIGDPARAYAGIRTEQGSDGGYSSVSYEACAPGDPRITGDDAPAPVGVWWVGGFLLRDRDSACLPLEITVGDDPTVHRVDLALPAGACG
ncbi:hypothetical protein BMH32_13250 [Leucobacter sp. OLJS4]|uniref:hypothetical protein n=1 Tax=unclassified Leucobacter TaxID=2621730 RepID=UPI000C1870CB|nr:MULTISPECIES: hypothetical protein [unclassified Leucobacter]PII84742.1 hypothetical protein BMH25_03010 [Leucobacter sp. OLCALW19]PII87837.1 hypothetical protein BMH26_08880 [Leucobacter sp. OLTLW20]PII92699.1 hypothetical protein BMH27_04860 [Leucobacter sp. OLAS13]PII98406.1 hypothetical protein BMH29_07580 [Leucobacter sp. OLDS2]PIJ05375.1 hypothetical protein BMH31_00885 [Leucobacter sp. OLIS6]